MPIKTTLSSTPGTGNATVTISATVEDPIDPVPGVSVTAELENGLEVVSADRGGHVTVSKKSVIWSDLTIKPTPTVLTVTVKCLATGGKKVTGRIIKAGSTRIEGATSVTCGT